METMTNQPPSTPMRLTPDQFQPGDVVRYFGERFVVAPPEMRGRNVAVAVEGVDGDPIIEYFPAVEKFRVLRPVDPPKGMSFESARQAERAWLRRNQAFTAAKT